jgi:hypothetical protein
VEVTYLRPPVDDGELLPSRFVVELLRKTFVNFVYLRGVDSCDNYPWQEILIVFLIFYGLLQVRAACRGAWARVAIDQFRHLAIRTCYEHSGSMNILANGTMARVGCNTSPPPPPAELRGPLPHPHGQLPRDVLDHVHRDGVPWGVGACHNGRIQRLVTTNLLGTLSPTTTGVVDRLAKLVESDEYHNLSRVTIFIFCQE